tara:strand:+ start:653 stop:1078 length:426 start_codon:yes stop_codon:yes gene_type:complete
MKNILVLCTGNSCRSQIAQGYLEFFLNNKANIYSAGIETHGINKYAVKVMSMDNIDIENNTSNLVHEYVQIDFDFIITVCDHANETCPYIPSENALRIHKNFEDPSKLDIKNENLKIDNYINCRNQIKDYCSEFSLKYFQE